MPEGEPRLDFRDMTEADLEDGLRLSRASGWNQAIGDWRLLLSLGPGLFRVAVEDGTIVASGGAVRYGDALAWICMILVDPAKRGHGIGTRIFDEVLDRASACVRDGTLRSVGLDATPAGRGIYVQRGFQDEGGIVRMRAEGRGPGPEL
ncbi:MAG TPA: GNAT family N-acetyltransferase, partial [Vicinamibacteria bacterium]|nr:GNAT family N-acetyltransferase [Vicinamibacteria bacterium]